MNRQMTEDSVLRTLTVHLPINLAFAAFTKGLATWWPREYTWAKDKLDTIGIEPREGGRCFQRGPHGFECDWGRVLTWNPPHGLVFSWHIGPERAPEPDPANASEVEVSFVAEGPSSTQVELEHRGFAHHGEGGEAYRAGLDSAEGWTYILDQYAAAANRPDILASLEETNAIAGEAASANLARLTDLISPYAIRVAATLRLADIMAEGVSDSDELAARAGVNADALGRLLHYLACRGVFRETKPGKFALTETARLLDESHPAGVRAWLDLDGFGGRMDMAFAGLLQAVRTGEPVWSEVFGRPFWDDLDSNPNLSASFDSLMGTHSPQFADMVAGYDWSVHHHVVDVGGGTGALLTEILRAHPTVRGTLVDLPATASRATETFASAGLDNRCTVYAQSFFDPLPAGGDVYVLRSVLHDWNDHDATEILRRCAEAAGREGRVLVESHTASDGNLEMTAEMDLRMLVLVGGRERTLAEFRKLVAAAGMTVQSTRRTPLGVSLMECVVAPST